jgi:hypothetical protein
MAYLKSFFIIIKAFYESIAKTITEDVLDIVYNNLMLLTRKTWYNYHFIRMSGCKKTLYFYKCRAVLEIAIVFCYILETIRCKNNTLPPYPFQFQLWRINSLNYRINLQEAFDEIEPKYRNQFPELFI